MPEISTGHHTQVGVLTTEPGATAPVPNAKRTFCGKSFSFSAKLSRRALRTAKRYIRVTMAVTQLDIDNLNDAIKRGVRSVTVGGQTVIYNTSESLIRARDNLQAQLNAQNAAATGQRRPKQTYLVQTGRGY